MSGDVQPRKRKDKKKKRDDEASHGVHITKMGSDDVLLHVQEEHGTGGHWCAKIIFFSLMAILLGLVGLIILENRGISDVDTPLSESRFSNYFDGWVDEHRDEHDDHHDSHGSLEHDDHEAGEEHDHDDEDDEHDEPYEEEADQSEGDDEELADEEEDDNVTPEEDADNATAENVTAEEEDDEEEEDDVDDEEEDTVTAEVDDNVTAEEADEDNATGEDDNATQEVTKEQNEDDEDDGDEDDYNGEDEEDDNFTKETSKPASQSAPPDDNDDDDDPFDEEEDDDGTFNSLEEIVDNDAAELELLKEKARQQAAESKQNTASAENDLEDEADSAPNWASSLTIKIGVGLALALVARLVLLRKKPISNEDEAAEIIMKRRMTIVTPEENIPEHAAGLEEPLPEDDYSEEEIEIEEEIEYIEEEEEVEPVGEENQIDAGDNDYVPETFEQLSAMYRSKDKSMETEQKNDTKPIQSETYSYPSPYNRTSANNNNNRNNNNPVRNEITKFLEPTTKSFTSSNEKKHNIQEEAKTKQATTPAVVKDVQVPLKYSPPAKDTTAKPELPNQQPIKREITFDMDYERSRKEQPMVEHKKEIAHDMDYQPDAEVIDYDEDDIYDDEDDEAQIDDSEDSDDEDLLDDEEADDEEVSDVDDSELMNRLEAKYGKLPAKEYESDEDPDDPTWTQIKPKTSGGPQSLEDDDVDLFEKELRRANDEMMQERYVDALSSFDRLIQKYPNEPRLYLGKAITYDHYAERHRSNRLLMKAIEVYQQYLEFDVKDNYQLMDYRVAAEHCLERMRFLGQFQQALPIYKRMIDKFPQKASLRNDLAVTYLMLDRLSDAKRVLEDVLQQWPEDGFALIHYGFVVKQLDKDYYKAALYLRKGIESKAPGTQEGRFYFHLGEALQRLGRQDEAREIFRQGADLKFYPSVYQRSLYNEGNLKAQPFWSLEETSYDKYLKNLQDNWLAIKAEGLNALSKTGYFLDESENLKDKGDWQEFELFRRGQQRRDNCLKAPITCNLINQFPAARDCKRGQVKFSVIQPGTHVWPHCGPTNCRLRAHLGLVVPNGTRLRVAEEERSWQEGEFLIFDDSFEHEVWHEGASFRLVLIVDIWHPDLTEQQRLSLNPI